MQHDPEKARYIIRSEDAKQLAELIDKIAQDPSIDLLDVIGPAGNPHTAVAAMPHDKARALEHDFSASKKMFIEPDRPLSLFENKDV